MRRSHHGKVLDFDSISDVPCDLLELVGNTQGPLRKPQEIVKKVSFPHSQQGKTSFCALLGIQRFIHGFHFGSRLVHISFRVKSDLTS